MQDLMAMRFRQVALCLLLAGCTSATPASNQSNAGSGSKTAIEPLAQVVRNPYALFEKPEWTVAVPFPFRDYRAYFEYHSRYFKWPNLPHALEVQWHECITGYSLSHFTKSELTALDAFARGRRKLTMTELSAFHEGMAARAGASDRDLEEDVRAYCPDTVDALVPYVQQGKYFTVTGFLYY